MPLINVLRTFLQLASPEQLVAVASPAENVVLHELTPCPVAVSRRLYREVGATFHWVDRLKQTDEELAAYLGQPDVRVFVARASERDVGFFELRRHPDRSVEIALFGLHSHAQGRGIGKWLLVQAAERGWDWGATRVWLHTCTLDAAAALPNYLARGFVPYRSENYQQDVGQGTSDA